MKDEEARERIQRLEDSYRRMTINLSDNATAFGELGLVWHGSSPGKWVKHVPRKRGPRSEGEK